MKLKVQKSAGGLGVVLPEELVSRWRIQEGATLELTQVSDELFRVVVGRPEPPTLEQKLAKADEIIARYRNTLSELSK